MFLLYDGELEGTVEVLPLLMMLVKCDTKWKNDCLKKFMSGKCCWFIYDVYCSYYRWTLLPILPVEIVCDALMTGIS